MSPRPRHLLWIYTGASGFALAVSLTVGVLHLPLFGLLGFSFLVVAVFLGVLLASTVNRRLILPVWIEWPRRRRFSVIGLCVCVTAVLWLLMSSDTPLASTWRWGAGPQVGRPVPPKGLVSWGQAVPSVFQFDVSSWPGLPDPEWAWRMTTDLPGRLGPVASRIDFRVTQPEGQVFNLSNGGQWEQYRGSDGVTVVFKAQRGEIWQRVHQVSLNLHASPGQRHWHTVEVDVPASSRSLAIEVESGANHLGDTVWFSADRVRVSVLGLWLDVAQLLSLAQVLSIFWLALVILALAVAGFEMLASMLEQSLLVWPLASLLIMAAAWVGTSQLLLFTGWQRAAWLSIKVNAQDRSLPPPFISINHTGEAGDFEPVTWPAWKSESTPVGIRPISSPLGLKILAIENEQQQAIPTASWRLPSSGMALDDRQALRVKQPGVLWLPNRPYPGSITIILDAGPGAGKVELDWLDQRQTFDLSSSTPIGYRAELRRPVTYQGWLLLPQQEIHQIRLKLGNRDSPYALHELAIYDAFPQTWTGSALAAGAASAAGCRLVPAGVDLRVERDASADCTLLVPNLRPLNAVSLLVRLLVWALFTFVGLVTLLLLSVLANAGRRWEQHYQIVDSRPVAWLRQRTAAWAEGRVALVIGITAVTFQLAYFLVVPIGYINDTHGYYSLARAYLKLPSLYAIDPARTPGYPIFLASTIWLVGDQMEGIVLVQHVVLSLLGPLTVWFLYTRTGPFFAALGGLLVGIGPTTSLLANTVSTESLFASVSYLALICAIQCQSRLAGVVLAGLLAGLATLIRPNGVLLPIAILLWLFLRWWCGQGRLVALRRLVPTGVALALGYLLMVSPWLRAEHGMTAQWELDRSSAFTLWLNSVIQGRSPATLAINRPASMIFDASPLAERCNDVEGWRLHSDLALARYIDWPVLGTAADSRFFGESVREGIRQNPRRFLQFFVGTFNYSLIHRLPPAESPLCVTDLSKSEIYYGRFSYPLPQNVARDTRDIEQLLPQLSYRWHPPRSRLRSAALWVTQAGMDYWWIVAALALAGLAVCAIVGMFRDAMLLGVYWLVAVTLLAVVGWPTDRYVYVLEPLVYVLAIVLVATLFGARVRRRVSVGGG